MAWVLDGLEVTIASNVGPDLTLHSTLNMSAGAVAGIATWYLIGEVIGALFFGGEYAEVIFRAGGRPAVGD